MDRRKFLKTVRDVFPPSPGYPSPPIAPPQKRQLLRHPPTMCSAQCSTPTTSPPPGFFVNAYLVETPAGIVVVDGTLTVSDSRAVRARLEAIGKPLLAVLVTHPHPDHYAGVAAVVAGNDVPIVSAASVEHIIRRDDAAKDR